MNNAAWVGILAEVKSVGHGLACHANINLYLYVRPMILFVGQTFSLVYLVELSVKR